MTILLKFTSLGILLSLVYGSLVEFIVNRLFRLEEEHDLHFSITILQGVGLIAGLLGIWSFFAPVNWFTVRVFSWLSVPILLIAGSYILKRVRVIFRQIIETGVLSWVAFAGFLTLALYLASASDITYDTGLYHAQSIHWIESYKVVPGIANIQDRIGFNSNLFLLAAFWGNADEGLFSYQVPGLVIFSALLTYCLFLMRKSRRALALSGFIAGGYLFYLLLEKGIVVWFASPTADLSAAFLSWTIFLLAMEKVQSGSTEEFDMATIALVILGLFDATLKLSTVPILLAAVYFLWMAKSSFSLPKLTGLAAFGTLMFIPWVVRNIFVSGYLFFPLYQLDILSVDWKVPRDIAKLAAETVIAWGRVPYEKPAAAMALSFSEWLPRWYEGLPRADLYLVNSILILLAFCALFLILKKRVPGSIQGHLPIVFILLVGCAYWFIQSPSPRFGYGFLVTLLLVLLSSVVFPIIEKNKRWGNGVMLLAQVALIGILFQSILGIPQRSWKHYSDTYKSLPVAEVVPVNIDTTVVFVPGVNAGNVQDDDAQCWYDAFPCMPFKQPGLHMRGEKIEDGFYIKR